LIKKICAEISKLDFVEARDNNASSFSGETFDL
jgi:hypothetical protein